MSIEAPQAHTATLKYGVSFVAVTKGDVQSGEPEVLITPRSALNATAIWNQRKRAISAALSVVEYDDLGQPSLYILYLPDKIATISVGTGGRITSDIVKHRLGRVPVALLRYNPDTDDRPLGRSKISRAVMSLTDQAVRTMLRTEVTAEFYSAPQRYLLGADESAFRDSSGNLRTGWEATIGRMLAIPFDDDGNEPKVGQFPQMNMQPHTEQLRSIAAMFAGETSIPISSLGIIHDNPASDAAMHTAYLDLIQDAERCHTTFGAGWVDVGRLAVQVRDNLEAPPAELRRLSANFRDAATPTKSAASQAIVEQVREGILPADSEVTLEQLGYDSVTIDRIQADRRKSTGRATLENLVNRSRDLAAGA